MKKITSALLILAVVFSLTACGEEETPKATVTGTPISTAPTTDIKTELNATVTESLKITEATETTTEELTFSGGNGDGYTPYDLRWVDGNNGIISFCVQEPDLGENKNYRITLYYEGADIVIKSITSVQESLLVTEDMKSNMDRYGAGEYVFLVEAWDYSTEQSLGKKAGSPSFYYTPEMSSSADSSDNSGTFEGDENGYGTWSNGRVYYKGNFKDGIPNGEGTLYIYQFDTYSFNCSVKGTWVNGLGNGEMTYTQHWGVDEVFDSFMVNNGKVAKTEDIGCPLTYNYTAIYDTDTVAVPPWGEIHVVFAKLESEGSWPSAPTYQ